MFKIGSYFFFYGSGFVSYDFSVESDFGVIFLNFVKHLMSIFPVDEVKAF